MLGTTAAMASVGCVDRSQQNAKNAADIRPQAAFVLKCDAASLTFTPLQYDPTIHDVVSQFGIDGCGQRVVYVNEGSVDFPKWVPHAVTAATQKTPVSDNRGN